MNEALKKLHIRFWKKVDIKTPEECWPWLASTDEWGYGNFSVNRKSKSSNRVAYYLMNDDSIDGLVVRHKCNNPPCCNPNHLLKGTHADNVQDRVNAGRSAIGSNNGRSKLNEIKVKEIKELLKTSISKMQIAKKFGVDSKVIRDIHYGNKWKHVA